MKYIIPIFSSLLFACGAEDTTVQNESVQRNIESRTGAAPNLKDSQGLKQGRWVMYGQDDPARGYPANGKIEEGNYKDDLKDGEWQFYKRNGKDVDSIAEYDQGAWIKTISRDSVATEIE